MAKKDTGKAFLDSVLKHIPEADRTAIGEKLGGNDALLEALGEQEEALAADRERLNGWYATNKGALAQAKQVLDSAAAKGLNLDLDADDDGDPADPLGLAARRPAAAPKGLDEQTVNKRIADAVAAATTQTEQQGLSLITKMTTLAGKHLQEFGEPLDGEALVNFAIKQNLRLDLAHEAFVADKRKTKTDAANAKAIADAEERGKAAGRTEALNRQIPIPPGSAASTLSGLTAEGKPDASIAGLVSAYREAVTAGQ